MVVERVQAAGGAFLDLDPAAAALGVVALFAARVAKRTLLGDERCTATRADALAVAAHIRHAGENLCSVRERVQRGLLLGYVYIVHAGPRDPRVAVAAREPQRRERPRYALDE